MTFHWNSFKFLKILQIKKKIPVHENSLTFLIKKNIEFLEFLNFPLMSLKFLGILGFPYINFLEILQISLWLFFLKKTLFFVIFIESPSSCFNNYWIFRKIPQNSFKFLKIIIFLSSSFIPCHSFLPLQPFHSFFTNSVFPKEFEILKIEFWVSWKNFEKCQRIPNKH